MVFLNYHHAFDCVFVWQDKSDVNPEQVKATLMLCYGYVTLYSPPTLIVSRMEATILRTISPFFPNVKVRCAYGYERITFYIINIKMNRLQTVDTKYLSW